MSAFVCMQCLGLECLFGVLHSVTSLSLIYPLRDAYLAAVFSTYTHICGPLWCNKDAGMVLSGIVMKSGLNSRSSAYGANHELQLHNRGNFYKVLINELFFVHFNKAYT